MALLHQHGATSTLDFGNSLAAQKGTGGLRRISFKSRLKGIVNYINENGLVLRGPATVTKWKTEPFVKLLLGLRARYEDLHPDGRRFLCGFIISSHKFIKSLKGPFRLSAMTLLLLKKIAAGTYRSTKTDWDRKYIKPARTAAARYEAAADAVTKAKY